MLKLFIIASLSLVCFGAGPTLVGAEAPDFSLRDHQGNMVQLSDYKNKTVVLEWTNPDCPFVVRHYKSETMKKLYNQFKDEGVVWLAINSTHYSTWESNAKWAKEEGLAYPVLDDHEGKVGKLYGAKTTPHMFVVKDGVVVYAGSIDDDPRGKADQPKNYVEQALKELLADGKVSVSAVKPYGCSVKYAK